MYPKKSHTDQNIQKQQRNNQFQIRSINFTQKGYFIYQISEQNKQFLVNKQYLIQNNWLQKLCNYYEQNLNINGSLANKPKKKQTKYIRKSQIQSNYRQKFNQIRKLQLQDILDSVQLLKKVQILSSSQNTKQDVLGRYLYQKKNVTPIITQDFAKHVQMSVSRCYFLIDQYYIQHLLQIQVFKAVTRRGKYVNSKNYWKNIREKLSQRIQQNIPGQKQLEQIYLCYRSKIYKLLQVFRFIKFYQFTPNQIKGTLSLKFPKLGYYLEILLQIVQSKKL